MRGLPAGDAASGGQGAAMQAAEHSQDPTVELARVFEKSGEGWPHAQRLQPLFDVETPTWGISGVCSDPPIEPTDVLGPGLKPSAQANNEAPWPKLMASPPPPLPFACPSASNGPFHERHKYQAEAPANGPAQKSGHRQFWATAQSVACAGGAASGSGLGGCIVLWDRREPRGTSGGSCGKF